MKNLTILGLQYGDEGKGKIIDLISIFYDQIIRNTGGHNAGHEILYNNIKKKIKVLPSGIFKKNCICLISDLVFFSINNFLNEIYLIKKILKSLIISRKSILNFKIDELIDYLIDLNLKIGTTKTGITSSSLKNLLKFAIKIEDFLKLNILIKIKKNFFFYNFFFLLYKIKIRINFKNFYFVNFFNFIKVKKNIVNSIFFINNYYKNIFENSQGVNLDLNFGTYPFVTCSNILSKSIFINSKFFYNNIKYVGIFKVYLTRVGNGFLITNICNFKNKIFSILNNERGTNTNRLRKIGWLDLNQLLNCVKINNISNLIITKLDSLIYIKKFKVLINYKIITNKKNIYNNNYYFPNFFIFSSWKSVNNKYIKNDINFHLFIRFVEKFLFTPINIISIGKKKFDIIIL